MFDFSKTFLTNRQKASDFLKDHPVICSFIACIFLCALSNMEQYRIDSRSVLIVFCALAVLSLCACIYLKCRFGLKNYLAVVAFILFAAISYFVCKKISSSERKSASLLLFSGVILLCVSVFLIATKKMTVMKAVAIIFIGALITRYCYALITSISTRCHDVVNSAGTDNPYTEGHMGYILYIFNKDFSLPKIVENGRFHDQFYHPPLHHFICAVFLKILTVFGVKGSDAYGSLQSLTLFYSCVTIIYGYKIIRLFKIDEKFSVLLFAVLAFHPAFIYMAADINNDMLSVAFMTVALYCACSYFKTEKWSFIVFAAICLGLGMMTKLSAYLIAIPIGFIFGIKFLLLLIGRKPVKKTIIQYCVFLAICAPLGLFFPIRNKILYDIPLGYVQKLPIDNWQYLGAYSVKDRLFSFRSLFVSIYDNWPGRASYMSEHEINPLVSLLKTAVFEEYINDGGAFSNIVIWAHVLYISNLVLVALAVAAVVYLAYNMIRYKKPDILEIAAIIGWGANLVSYYVFCFAYPHHCSMNMRYATFTILFGLIFVGTALTRIKDECESKGRSTAIAKDFSRVFTFFGVAFSLAAYGLILKLARA